MLYYFDTSALVKRYVQELGTPWVIALCDPAAGHTIATARITKAESAAAFAGKHRGGGLLAGDYIQVLQRIADDFLREYTLVETTPSVVDLAVELTQRHKLRGYDAVQLASGLTLNATLILAQLPPIIFVGADNDLLAAARGEGLAVDNPNNHP